MKRWQPLILVLALSGCAASSGDVADESPGAPEKVCVNVRNITSYDVIDDQHMYIKARGQQKHFLFTMHGRCLRLRSASTIAVVEPLTSVCSNSFGKVIYNEGGRDTESCRIRTIEAVSSKDDAKGLVEDRKAAKREERSESE